MFDCPRCNKETKRLTICEMVKRIVCDACHPEHGGSKFNWQLHDVLHRDGRTKVTRGKAWEIDQRIKSPDDGRTIINRKTGKPAQY